MSRRSTLLVVRVAMAIAVVGVVAVLHLPAPSAMADPQDQVLVRQTWQAGGDALSWLARPFPDGLVDLGGLLVGDKMAHAVLFWPLGLLATLARRLARRPVWPAVGWLLALAAASEVVQRWEGRRFDPLDVLANALGIGAGLLTTWVLVTMVRRMHR